MDTDTLEFSVLVPLLDDRDNARACIESWLAQTFEPSRFEIVVIATSHDALDRDLRSSLRAQDRVFELTNGDMIQSWQFGADQARGKWIFITEAHCLADPRCLEELDRYLGAQDVAGALCRSVPICSSMMSDRDAACFEEGFEAAVREGSWRRLIVHGTALRRQLFHDFGGFPLRYSRFAEWVFQARLHRAGHHLGYAPKAVVRHVYRESLRDLIPELADYTRGECVYRDEHPHEAIAQTTCFPPEWTDGYEPNLRLARTMAAMLAKEGLRSPGRDWKRQLGDIARLALLSQRGRQWLAWLAMFRAMWRTWRRRDDADRVDAPYREFKAAIVLWARYRFLAGRRQPPPPFPLAPGSCSIVDLPEESLIGFHCREHGPHGHIRWSKALAGMEFRLAPADYTIAFDSANIRGDLANWMGEVYFNGRRLEKEFSPQGELHIALPAAAFTRGDRQVLMWTCQPWDLARQHQDQRELGFPLRDIGLRRAG